MSCAPCRGHPCRPDAIATHRMRPMKTPGEPHDASPRVGLGIVRHGAGSIGIGVIQHRSGRGRITHIV